MTHSPSLSPFLRHPSISSASSYPFYSAEERIRELSDLLESRMTEEQRYAKKLEEVKAEKVEEESDITASLYLFIPQPCALSLTLSLPLLTPPLCLSLFRSPWSICGGYFGLEAQRQSLRSLVALAVVGGGGGAGLGLGLRGYGIRWTQVRCAAACLYCCIFYCHSLLCS